MSWSGIFFLKANTGESTWLNVIYWGGGARGHKKGKGGMREGKNPRGGRLMSSGHAGIRGSILLDALRNKVEFTSESSSQEMGKLGFLTDCHSW